MSRERTQMNINIDPALLLSLKSQATKRGQTLTDFVVEQLKGSSDRSPEGNLEKRLLRIEQFLELDKKVSDKTKKIGTIFTDLGAKEYGEVAKAEFESYTKNKGLTLQTALKELNQHLKNYPHSNPELVFQILMGTHVLTGEEMTQAYRFGSCAMRSALNDLTNDPLEKLNQAFLNAVKQKSLA